MGSSKTAVDVPTQPTLVNVNDGACVVKATTGSTVMVLIVATSRAVETAFTTLDIVPIDLWVCVCVLCNVEHVGVWSVLKKVLRCGSKTRILVRLVHFVALYLSV